MSDVLSIRVLRHRWKPHKERLQAQASGEATMIRFHRACSWLARVEINAEDQDTDLVLVGQWIAFNSLYGQWDPARREPKSDRESWRGFVDHILRLDRDNQLVTVLQAQKRLAMSLVEDEYLSNYFWQDPSGRPVSPSKRAKRNAQTWYLEGRWKVVLDELLDRIYLMRCQLVHGAATYGGKLNRTSLRRCSWMLQHLMTSFLLVWIDHGSDENWGVMCYPPLQRELNGMMANDQRPKTAK